MLKHGNFDTLAKDYSQYRPGYSQTVLDAILGLIETPVNELDFVDVGAGTGIWTRMVNDMGVRTSNAIEPSDNMRAEGESHPSNNKTIWRCGSAEKTGLEHNSFDLLTMASSFHWPDFAQATQEFHRVLRDGGWFFALWNPRVIEVDPLQVDIEKKIKALCPAIKRVSSGNAEFTETLMENMLQLPIYEDVIYLEGRHTIKRSKSEYIGVWKSVNDVRYQLGEENFENFLKYINERVGDDMVMESTHKTRAWGMRKKQ